MESLETTVGALKQEVKDFKDTINKSITKLEGELKDMNAKLNQCENLGIGNKQFEENMYRSLKNLNRTVEKFEDDINKKVNALDSRLDDDLRYANREKKQIFIRLAESIAMLFIGYLFAILTGQEPKELVQAVFNMIM